MPSFRSRGSLSWPRFCRGALWSAYCVDLFSAVLLVYLGRVFTLDDLDDVDLKQWKHYTSVQHASKTERYMISFLYMFACFLFVLGKYVRLKQKFSWSCYGRQTISSSTAEHTSSVFLSLPCNGHSGYVLNQRLLSLTQTFIGEDHETQVMRVCQRSEIVQREKRIKKQNFWGRIANTATFAADRTSVERFGCWPAKSVTVNTIPQACLYGVLRVEL